MGTKGLDATLRTLEEEIAGGMRELSAAGPDTGLVLEVCYRHRQLGCGLLLERRDVDGFQHALYRSAHLYLWLLEQRDLHARLDTFFLCKSRALPLLDAVAIGHHELARSMGRKMVFPFQAHMEIEEDYLYFDLLAAFLVKESEGEEALVRFEDYLQGEPCPRLEAVKALIHRDAEGFWEALPDVTLEWEEQFEADRISGAMDPFARHTEDSVFVEGMALIRLAEARGIRRREGLPFIPDVAFQAPSKPFPKDVTPELGPAWMKSQKYRN
jgi:hypothetical protein